MGLEGNRKIVGAGEEAFLPHPLSLNQAFHFEGFSLHRNAL